MKTKMKQMKGITLIALVITIIVLLILAGVSIAMLTGENGILTKATQAQNEHADATIKEAIGLAYNEYQIMINEPTGKVINNATKIASTTQVKIQGQEEKHLATLSMSFWDFLKDEKQYIDENGVIDVKTLVGETLSKGNGTGDNDVYKIVQEKGGYVLKYYENSAKQTNLWEIETVSDEEIFVYDETEEGIEIVGLDFSKLQYEEAESEFGIYGSESNKVSATKIKNLKTLKIPDTINGKNVISVSFTRSRSIESSNIWNIIIGIEEIIYPSTIKVLESSSLEFSSVKKVELPEGLEEINKGAFYGITELKEITIPSSVKRISSRAFYPTRGVSNNDNLIVNIKGKDSDEDFDEIFDYYNGKFAISWTGQHATVNYLGK